MYCDISHTIKLTSCLIVKHMEASSSKLHEIFVVEPNTTIRTIVEPNTTIRTIVEPNTLSHVLYPTIGHSGGATGRWGKCHPVLSRINFAIHSNSRRKV